MPVTIFADRSPCSVSGAAPRRGVRSSASPDEFHRNTEMNSILRYLMREVWPELRVLESRQLVRFVGTHILSVFEQQPMRPDFRNGLQTCSTALKACAVCAKSLEFE